MSNSNMNIRIDNETKKQAELHFNLSLNTPNAETIEAMNEAEKISCDPKAKRYSDFSELLEEVKKKV